MGIKEKFHINTNLNICVTGASGFVGSSLVNELLKIGFNVRVLTRGKYPKKHKKLTIIKCNLLSQDNEIDKFLNKCDILIHCAGELKDENKMFQLHVEATKMLLNKFASSPYGVSKSKHFIQLSSVGAYGKFIPPNIKRVISEKNAENPCNNYEYTKTLSDKILRECSKQKKFFYTILRPTNIVGFNMKNNSFFSLINTIAKKNFFYIGSRESIMTYIHIDDVVNALILCITNPKSRNQTFIVSNDCSLKKIVESVIIKKNYIYCPICLPETFVRIISLFLSKFFNFPLTANRINYLVSKTTYSSKKIQKILNFLPKNDIPSYASSVIHSKNKIKV